VYLLFPFRKTALLGLFGLFSFLASAQPVVWVTSSLQRTSQTGAASSGTQAQISGGKGEYESFQIVVRGPASGLSNVNVTVSDLTGPGNAVIPSSSFSLFREHYVYVNLSSPNWGGSNQPLGAGWYADGLIPFNDPSTGASLANSSAALKAVPFNLNANTNQPIWVDVLIPRSAVAGQYSGTFTVTSNQGNATGTISLTVWNFTLPMKSSLRSSFLYWNNSSLAANQELLRNKLEPIRTDTSQQSTLMSNFGLGGVGLPFWSGADMGTCTMSAAPSVSQIQASAAAQAPGLDRYVYSADEIDACPGLFSTMKQWGNNLHQAGVKNLVTMSPTAALFDDGSNSGRSAVDIWVVLPLMYDGAASAVNQAIAKGDQVWSYNALVQDSYSPKWTIDFAPINFRIQPGFINQSLGLTGLLYWKVDGWNASDPWNQVNNTGVFSSNNYPGDGHLVYPGTQVGISGVAPSMRLKWLRDGVEDYEYVAMLKAAGQGNQALSLSRTAGANWSSWTRDPNVLASVRQQLGALLDQVNGGSGNTGSAPPPETSAPPAQTPPPSGGSTPPSASTTVPPKPVNPSPAIGATGVGLNATLSWGAAAGATSYDVYFGSSTVALVGTVNGTSFNPGALAPNTTYTWGVVAKNSAGDNSSATWTFTTGAAQAPTSGSSTSGAGRHLFSFVAGQANSVRYAQFLFTKSGLSALNACYVSYDPLANVFYLLSDDMTQWYGLLGGSANTVGNAQCTIHGASSNSTKTATDLTTNVDISFRLGFGGLKTIYQSSGDMQGGTSGWQQMGTWDDAGDPNVVELISLTPSSGTGAAQTFIAVVRDGNGAGAIPFVQFVVGATLSGFNGCFIHYDRASNVFFLLNDAGTAWSGLIAGSAGQVSNSQCTLKGTGSGGTAAGSNLTITYSLEFSAGFAGSKKIFMQAVDNTGVIEAWRHMATWTI
jgi:hypothetical protein